MEQALSLAAGELELGLNAAGDPESPVLEIALDEWRDAPEDRIARTAQAVASTLRLTVGVLESEPTPELAPLLEATTLTLGTATAGAAGVQGAYPQLVPRDDIAASLDGLRAAVGRNPRSSVTLARLLRQTATPDIEAGLAAEAAAYSMLLGGTEFAAWRAGRPVRPVTASPRPPVRIERSDENLTIVLDNPERRNALSMRLREALLEACRLAELDPSIEQVALRGAGPVFCSGGDLDEFGVATDLVAAYLVRLERAPWRILDRMRDRVTAYVHGACIGAGIEMSAFAGRVVADPDAYFLLPEIGMGLVPGAGGTVSVPRRIGRWRAAWMMLTGEPIDAELALRWGLVDDITPHRPS